MYSIPIAKFINTMYNVFTVKLATPLPIESVMEMHTHLLLYTHPRPTKARPKVRLYYDM